jgi:putative transposase
VDEAAIFRTIEAMRAIADGAMAASKTARRQRERRLKLVAGDGRQATHMEALARSDGAEKPADLPQPHERMFHVEEWA